MATVEVRWFFDQKPEAVGPLFADVAPESIRTDWYAWPCDRRSGVKTREGRLEAKLRLQDLGAIEIGVAGGRVEQWEKWSLPLSSDGGPTPDVLTGAGWVAVEKARQLRVFALEGDRIVERDVSEIGALGHGCLFELTRVRARGRTGWTVAFEAFGPAEALVSTLLLVAAEALGDLAEGVEGFEEENSYGYPRWLGESDEEA